MGRRGPSGKPTKLRLIDGDRKSRINTNEPAPRQESPTAAEEMAAPVRAVWDRTLAELEFMGLAAAADGDALRCYCEAVVVHEKASAVLAKSPVLIQGIHGNMVRNPALQVQRDAAQTIRAFAQEFGLTPSGRTRIRMEEATGRGEPESNPFLASR